MARRKPIKDPAACHPERETYADQLCGVCFFDRNRLPPDPARAEERQALIALHQQAEHVTNLAKEAKAIVRQNLPRYAELHLTAAEIAASDGDARPAQWALESIPAGKEGPVATPPAKTTGAPGEGGFKVIIGINMGGMPQKTEEALVVDATPVPSSV
jgi:hypothetical protein